VSGWKTWIGRTSGTTDNYARLHHPLFGTSVRIPAAQIDLIGAPWLMFGEDPSSTPNGGSV